ncbi:ABC transporter substrate-binding protein [Paenibacillus filicis]|uniref:ABC transporter substrate-binding protein n=1 Tax=Paenibacillus filicis TaxID=669464 RepID=A0ABU9DSG1_9BACL
MHIAHHYLQLKRHYSDQGREPFSISLEQLAALLCCSTRNVKLILKQCTELGWICRTSGRGRGKLSTLALLAEPQDVLLPLIQAHIERGRYPEAMDLMREYAPQSPLMNREVLASISRQLGVKAAQSQPDVVASDLLRLPFYRELPSLDPLHAARRTELHLAGQIFDTLIDWDGVSGQVTPRLAFHTECSDDGREWRFHLRKGVTFHDGRPCTAEDIRSSLLWAAGLGNGQRDGIGLAPSRGPWQQLGLIAIEALHPRVLHIRLKAPNALLLPLLASAHASILPEAPGPDFPRLPVGTGPFRVLRNDAELLVLEAHAGYFRGRPQLDRIEMWILKELLTQQASSASLGGQPLLYTHPFQIHAEGAEQAAAIERTEGGCTFLLMNARKRGPLQCAELRRTIRTLLDNRRCIAELGGQRMIPAISFFPDWSAGDADTPAAGRTGFPSDRRITHGPVMPPPVIGPIQSACRLQLYTHPILNHSLEQTAGWIRHQLQAAHLDVDIHVLPDEQFRREGETDDADLLLLNPVNTPNREWSLLNLLEDASTGIRPRLPADRLEAIDEQLAALAAEDNPGKRQPLLRGLEALMLSADSVHLLYHVRQVSFHQPGLIGAERDEPYGWVDFSGLAIRPS